MKLGFVHSEKYFIYDELIKDITENIKGKIKNEQVLVENIDYRTSRKKYELYVILSDDMEDLKNCISKFKCKGKTVLITANLSEEYIIYALNDVIDIVYARNNIEIVTNRIIDNVRKCLCIEK